MNILLYDRCVLASFLFFSESSCGIHLLAFCCPLVHDFQHAPGLNSIMAFLGYLTYLFPMTISLNFLKSSLKRLPCKGLVKKSASISSVGQYTVSMAPVSTLSLMTKFLNLMCLNFCLLVFCRSFRFQSSLCFDCHERIVLFNCVPVYPQEHCRPNVTWKEIDCLHQLCA